MRPGLRNDQLSPAVSPARTPRLWLLGELVDHPLYRLARVYPRREMISWKALGVALLFVGLLGGIKVLFDLVEKNRRPKC